MNQQNTNMNSPATGILGAHPIGVGLGAVGIGAATGAVGGSLAGPVGAVAGAAVGAVVGGLAGSAAAEALDPTIETKFWRDNHSTRPYASSTFGYDEYAPAYRYGWESFTRHGAKGTTFESIEAELGRSWDQVKGASTLGWDKAKEATRDAWNRVKSVAHAGPKSGAAPACNSRDAARV